MKKTKNLSSLLILFLFLSLYANLWGADPKKTTPDTTGQKITRVKVGDEGITIKTEEGKELTEKTGRVTLGKEGIKIETVEPEETTTTEINIKLGGRTATTIELNGGDLVKFGKDITIEESEKVPGDVVALGGDVRVNGLVEGDVVSIGGDIRVSSTGIIEKDAVSIGGEIVQEPGAIIKGRSQELGFLPGKLLGFHTGPHFLSGVSFIFSLFKILFLFFLGIVVLALVPKNVQKVKDKITKNPWQSALIGFLGEILILPVFILLLITIIGIPVAIIILPLAILLGFLLGYTSISLLIGEKLKQNTNLKPQTQMLTLVLGILTVEFISLFASFLRIFWGFFSPFALIFAILGALITYIVLTVGFGGAILTLLGTKPKDKPVVPVTPAPDNAPSPAQTG
jgi:hypothetical protein